MADTRKITKPFNLEYYKKNDKPGKEVVIKYLEENGFRAIENGDEYGIDVATVNTFYEVERRNISTSYWPFSTVHIPFRKEKFFKNQKVKVVYVVNVHHNINGLEYDTLLICDADEILQHPLVEQPTPTTKGELFYDVPLYKWEQVNLGPPPDNLDWQF
jgi:hypothetical protein